MTETIALFGATGATGGYFLKLALEKGFHVKAMVRTPSKLNPDLQQQYPEALTVIQGDFSNKDSITTTVQGTHYVVSMAGGPHGKPKEYPPSLMFDFVTLLCGVLKETNPSIKVLLYQAGVFSTKPNRKLPFVMNIVKTVVGKWVIGIGPNMEDNNNVVRYLHDNSTTLGFPFIVSRPGPLHDKPSHGGPDELTVDHFNGTLFATTFYDLAQWSLKAIQDPSLYGTYPYVVHREKDLLASTAKK